MEPLSVLIVIPTLNEEKNIEQVLSEAKRYADEIIVVDGHSNDRVSEIITKKFPDVLVYQTSRGKGRQIRFGFSKAIEKSHEFIVMMDGDGERTASDIPAMISEAKRNGLDIVVGERGYKDMRSISRRIFNRLGTFWINFLTGYRLCDAFSGHILFKRNTIKKMNLRSDNFEIETEILLESFKRKLVLGSHRVRVPHLSKSKLKTRHFFEIAKFYTRWVLDNIDDRNLKLPMLKRLFLKLSCRIVNLPLFLL